MHYNDPGRDDKKSMTRATLTGLTTKKGYRPSTQDPPQASTWADCGQSLLDVADKHSTSKEIFLGHLLRRQQS